MPPESRGSEGIDIELVQFSLFFRQLRNAGLKKTLTRLLIWWWWSMKMSAWWQICLLRKLPYHSLFLLGLFLNSDSCVIKAHLSRTFYETIHKAPFLTATPWHLCATIITLSRDWSCKVHNILLMLWMGELKHSASQCWSWPEEMKVPAGPTVSSVLLVKALAIRMFNMGCLWCI